MVIIICVFTMMVGQYEWTISATNIIANNNCTVHNKLPNRYDPNSILLERQKYPFNLSHIKTFCNVSYYKWYGRIYNCSSLRNKSKLKIGIVTAQLSFNFDIKWNEENDNYINKDIKYRKALLNHIGYAIKHDYIYFEIRNLIERNLSNFKYLKSKHIIIGQKPFIIDQIFNDFNNLNYLLWIDSDVLFYQCSYSIEKELIYRSYNIYNKLYPNHNYDFIWDRSINAGVMLWKNSIWTKNILNLEKWILINAKKLNFYSAPPKYSGDQKCVWSLISGYHPFNENKLSFVDHLRWFDKMHQKLDNISGINFNDKIINKNNQSIIKWFMNKLITDKYRNNIALLPSFYINFAAVWFFNKQFTLKMNNQQDPFIIHFAGPPNAKALFEQEPFKYLNCFVPLSIRSTTNSTYPTS